MRVVSCLVQTTDTTPEQLGRRERKKAETRRAIRRAALELARELGVEGLTVAQISEVADVAPRTFFNYFACKEDALVGDGSLAAAELRERMAARPLDEAPLGTLRAVISEISLVPAMEADREQMLVRQRLIQEHESLMARQLAQLATLERALAEGLAERRGHEVDEDLRSQVLAALALGVLRVAIRRWVADDAQSLGGLITAGFEVLQHDD